VGFVGAAFVGAAFVGAAFVGAALCSCSEDDEVQPWDYTGSMAAAGSGSGSPSVVADAGPSYACPDPGAAFVLDQGTSSGAVTVVPWYRERWCESDGDCANGESCFKVTAERGLCAAPQGVTCADFVSSQGAATGTALAAHDAGGDAQASAEAGLDGPNEAPGAVFLDAGSLSCESGNQCFYDKADGFLDRSDKDTLTPVCASNGCTSDADCADEELCVPGWVGPRSSNTCMVSNCRSDDDCSAAPCGMCVFLQIVGWPVDTNPLVTFLGSGCL
jgi:hypothetical protein